VAGNREDAEDALQDGLLSAYRNLKRFEGRSQVSTWLTRIVVNAALMKRRSASLRRVISLDDASPDESPILSCLRDGSPNPEQVYAAAELRGMIRERLAKLSPLLQTTFILREIAGYSQVEVARHLGAKGNAVKARLWRARHQLATGLRRCTWE
jgi:RNA polymerase sigma-70 factor (ECF subfamily)